MRLGGQRGRGKPARLAQPGFDDLKISNLRLDRFDRLLLLQDVRLLISQKFLCQLQFGVAFLELVQQ